MLNQASSLTATARVAPPWRVVRWLYGAVVLCVTGAWLCSYAYECGVTYVAGHERGMWGTTIARLDSYRGKLWLSYEAFGTPGDRIVVSLQPGQPPRETVIKPLPSAWEWQWRAARPRPAVVDMSHWRTLGIRASYVDTPPGGTTPGRFQVSLAVPWWLVLLTLAAPAVGLHVYRARRARRRGFDVAGGTAEAERADAASNTLPRDAEGGFR